MIVGNFNLHQILFSLEMFDKKSDKLGFLYQTKKELQRIINCFESSKVLPLKMYAVDSIQIDGNCAELKTFVRKQYSLASKDRWEKRYPTEGQLRTLVTKEVVGYKKIMLIIDGEIKLLERSTLNKKEINYEPRNISINIKEINHQTIVSLLAENETKIIWEFSIGELIELVNSLATKKLVRNLNEGNLPKFIVDNFVDENQNNFSLEQVKKVHSMFLLTIFASKVN